MDDAYHSVILSSFIIELQEGTTRSIRNSVRPGKYMHSKSPPTRPNTTSGEESAQLGMLL